MKVGLEEMLSVVAGLLPLGRDTLLDMARTESYGQGVSFSRWSKHDLFMYVLEHYYDWESE